MRVQREMPVFGVVNGETVTGIIVRIPCFAVYRPLNDP
jgi:hypothetical protein